MIHGARITDLGRGGMDNVYIDKTQLFRDLFDSQEVMSNRILELCKAQPNKSAAQKSAALKDTTPYKDW